MTESLTRREREVAVLVAHGYSNAEIGVKLVIRAESACEHVLRINDKLMLRNRTQLAIWAVKHGLVRLDDIAI